MLKISHDLDKLTKRLSAIEKQIPFAAAKSLTVIGRKVKVELGAEVGSNFDKPTPYIRNSPFSTVATKARPETIVGIMDQSGRGASPAKYVKEHFGSGIRNQKPFEVLLSRMGALPVGWKAVPAAGIKLDAFGNPNRAQLREIFGALGSGLGVVSGRGKRQSRRAYFIIAPGNAQRRSARLVPGVWRRIESGGKSTIIPVLLFVSSASYRKTINLSQIAGRVITRDFNSIFAGELVKAVGTAR